MIEQVLSLIIIFENYFLVGIFQYLCVRRTNKRGLVILTLILTVEAFVLGYIQMDQVLRMIFPMGTIFIYSLYLNSSRWLHNMLCVGLSLFNMVLTKSLIILVVTFVSQVDFNNAIQNYTMIFLMTCLSIVILSLEYFYLNYVMESKIFLSRKSMIILGIYLLLVFITMSFSFHEFMYENLPWEMCCYLTIASIIVLYLAVYLTISNSRYYEQTIEQALKLEAEEYKTKYIDLIHEKTKEYNKLEHDYKHHFNVLRSMLKDNHNKEAEIYIDDLESQKSSDLIYVNHSILNYLLNDKKTYAASLGIEMECLIVGEAVSFISDIDYSVLLGNLLDNAIEETQLVNGKLIEISIQFEDERAIFEVKNKTHLTKNAKVLKTNKKNKQEHGYGLKNIQDVVHKYGGQDNIHIKDGYFTHMCILYKVE